MKPHRVQRKRTAGWRMPPNTVSVTRPGKWGNPFPIGREVTIIEGGQFEGMAFAKLRITPELSMELFRCLLKQTLSRDPDYLEPLRGKNLACFCPLTEPCHADIYLDLANPEEKL